MGNWKHGHARRITGLTPTYKSYSVMLSRCLNPKATHYENYGGRGITVCAQWQYSFQHFLDDMGERPEGTTLDRIDPNGNYEPSNCRWADWKQQNNNKRNSVVVTIGHLTGTVQQLCDEVGIRDDTFRRRLKLGWDATTALFTKVGTVTRWSKF